MPQVQSLQVRIYSEVSSGQTNSTEFQQASFAVQGARKKPRVEEPPAGGSVLGFLSPALVYRLEPLAGALRGATTLGSAPPTVSAQDN